MKYLHRLTGILMAFCLMIVLFITSIEAVVYWTPGYFEKEYTKYEVLKDLPAMTMEDLLEVTDEMMDYLRGDREDLHVMTSWTDRSGSFSMPEKSPIWRMFRDCFWQPSPSGGYVWFCVPLPLSLWQLQRLI